MKKGYTLTTTLGTLLISSIVLFTLTQLSIFLIRSQTRTAQHSEMVRESIIVQQEIHNRLVAARPTSYTTCATYTYCYEFITAPTEPNLIVGFDGLPEDMQVYVYYTDEAPYQVSLNTTLSNATIGLTSCTSCTEQILFEVSYQLYPKQDTILQPYKTRFAFLLY